MDSGAWLHETFPDMQQALKDLKCGAKTRAGTPCKLSTLYACTMQISWWAIDRANYRCRQSPGTGEREIGWAR